jgi:hypothetical protein
MQQQGPWAFLAGMMVCLLIFLAVYLIVYILFMLNLHRTLNAVSERNRELTPGLVWLSMIPLFNIIWNVIMVPKISNSLRNEYEDRGWSTSNEGFARVSGMIWAWGGVVNIVFSVFQNVAQAADMAPIAMVIGLLGCPLGIAIFVCWIMFWVQTYQYRKRLETEGRGYEPGSLEEDYDDEYRRPRKEQEDDFDRPRREDEYPDEKDDPERRRDEY